MSRGEEPATSQQVRESMPGARQTPGLAVGRSLLPSPEEWAVRNRELTASLVELINRYAPSITGRALDVGCQWGVMLDNLARETSPRWWGADPVIERHLSRGGHELVTGTADELPFADEAFDCLVLANVYEHIPPAARDASLIEMHRVLVPGGVVVGQLPNPRFPIESHSKLPFMGWLPPRAQNWYWRISPSRRGAGFYSVTVGDLVRRAHAAGFETALVRKYNYPVEAAPERVRWLVRLVRRPMAIVPWSWQFVLRRPQLEGGVPAGGLARDVYVGNERLLADPGEFAGNGVAGELGDLAQRYLKLELGLIEAASQTLRRLREAAAPDGVEEWLNVDPEVVASFEELALGAPSAGDRPYRGPEWQWLQEALALLTRQSARRTDSSPATKLTFKDFRSRL